jgi:hypothetical protein
MKIKITFLLAAFLVVMPNISDAQIGSMLKNKLNKAINKGVQNKADSAAAKNQDQQGDEKTEGRRGIGIGILGGKTDIKHNDEYDFTGRIYMQMEAYDKKDVSKSDYYTYFNANTMDAGIEVKAITQDADKSSSGPMAFIFDGANRCFMMLMGTSDSKTGIISTIPDDSTLNAQAKKQRVQEEKPVTITKTDNTKMIAGYKCDEYKIVEEGVEGYSNVWMTKDVKIKADKKYWGKAGIPTYYGHTEFEGSMMLALESYNKDNKLEMKMETKEINENFKHTISTVGYSFIKMNFGQAGKK